MATRVGLWVPCPAKLSVPSSAQANLTLQGQILDKESSFQQSGIAVRPGSVAAATQGALKPVITVASESLSGNRLSRQRRRASRIAASLSDMTYGSQSQALPKRRVVEHLTLYRMDDKLPVSVEQEMLDTLYTLQYCCPSILSISLGRISDSVRYPREPSATRAFTHAQCVRFPSKAALQHYKEHPAQLKAMAQQVQPFCSALVSVDFEADVDDDIETVFRRGDDFESGVDHLVLLKVAGGAPEATPQQLLDTLAGSMSSAQPVQITAGTNFSSSSAGITHGMLTRFHSVDDVGSYLASIDFVEALKTTILPHCDEFMAFNVNIDPVGKKVM